MYIRSPLVVASFASCLLFFSARAADPEKLPDGVLLTFPDHVLKVQVCSPDIIRVAAAPDRKFFQRESWVVVPLTSRPAAWKLESNKTTETVRTDHIQARVDRATGAVTFLDASGKVVLAEKSRGRTLTRAQVSGEKVLQVRQQWDSPEDEDLYGLGQSQAGVLNLKGRDLDLWQRNTEVFVPFFVSSRGYGILWDNTSYTRFGDLRPLEAIPEARLLDSTGKAGGLTGTYFADRTFSKAVATRLDPRLAFSTQQAEKQINTSIHPDLPPGDISVRWEGSLETPETGSYTFQTYSDGGVHLWIDGREVMNHWRQDWLPGDEVARVQLDRGRHRIKLEWVKDQGAREFHLFWKTPSHETATSLWSEAAEGLDYYFIYGPKLDRVISGYRTLTGPAPMMPRWMFGLWQSRQRYETAQQLTDTVKGFRLRQIPFDVIVQDWFYWPEDAWGSHAFDSARFPNPDAWVKQLHDELHARIMISVWGKFYPGTENFDALKNAGYLYEPNLTEGLKDWIGYRYTFYDAFIPGARQMFWSQVDRALFKRGFDAWWLDATEPDLLPTPALDGQRSHLESPAGGKRIQLLNAYALAQSRAVYEGQRASAPDQRVFILTRSGFAGQQRYAAATWSGDITSTWTAMKKQIPAGLGLSISGVPYWTMDTGGFSVPRRFSHPKDPYGADVQEWRELNTRWFEFATFVPILRVHGEKPFREMWEFGGDDSPAFQAMLDFDRLRYRLFPYTYSLGGDVTHNGGTIMRPLVLDFLSNQKTRDLTDQYMFGPAFLVSPVTSYGARERSVYLPAGTRWYDFWTGQALEGGKTVTAPAPFDRIPVHVRAGSIIPFGPEIQFIGQRPNDSITLMVYRGANGSFTLYEDDGLTYAYEKGAFSKIPLQWNDRADTLTIGKRLGEYPGMLKDRIFEIVIVDPKKPVGFSFKPTPVRTIVYHGEAVNVEL